MLSTIHRINRDDRIDYVDEGWMTFARKNWRRDLTREDVIGRSLWDFMSGDQVIQLWRGIFKTVRERQAAFRIHYRCDSPDQKRYMILCLSPHAKFGIEHWNVLLSQEDRAPVTLLDPKIRREQGELILCSFCKRLCTPGAERGCEWLEIEDAVNKWDLLEGSTLPKLTEGVCRDCRVRIGSDLDRLREENPL